MELGKRGSLAAVSRAIFSPDGKIILMATADFTVKLYHCDALGSIEELIILAREREKRVE
jgi:hypothetical protein